MKIRDRILSLLEKQGELSVKEMVEALHVSKQAIHVSISQLLEESILEKYGKVPKTIYKLKKVIDNTIISNRINPISIEYLKNQFLIISDTGQELSGIDGFTKWCTARKLPIEKTIVEYIDTKKKYDAFYNKFGIINGKEKLHNTKGYDQIFLDDIYYLDFYAIERFGKTKLGTLLHYAKQGQNKYLMKKLVEEIKPMVEKFISVNNFDAIGYVPPTIRREVQLMKYLETHLKINLPKIKIQKISGIIPIPQKSLSKLEERINNADHTFALNEVIRYKHVLLLDDAVGSGSTLNQIAGKIKKKKIADQVTGLAIVGSFKGFDVITDV